MNLAKWDPFNELEEVSKSLNRFFGRTPARNDPEFGWLAEVDWTPTVDISETETQYLIKAELSGMSKDDIKVTLENGLLGIRGERKQEKEEKGRKFHRVERSYGSFMRSFRLPGDADESSIKAEFKDGLLNVSVNKSEKAKPKSVEVAVN